MASKETRGVTCPFCGAPYTKIVPYDVVQIKCNYCGAAFQIPPKLGVDIPPCSNHPEKFASGICNDCTRSFCTECLSPYGFKADNESGTLYLCPECLAERNVKKANAHVISGIILLAFGAFLAIPLLIAGIFLAVIGAFEIFYGLSKRSQLSKQLRSETLGFQREEKEPEADAELLYDKLLAKYIERWGVVTGREFLENEINAYVWRGEPFAEAVRKVYQRQKRGT